MAVITINTNAGQDAVLARLLVKMNAERAAASPPLTAYADVQEMVRDILKNAVVSYNQNQLTEDLEAIATAYTSGNASLRAAIKNAAGV